MISAEDEVEFSPKCAAVLVVAMGAGVGAGVAYVAAPVALCTVGFCPVGVAGDSFAAWWQATFPLVAKRWGDPG